MIGEPKPDTGNPRVPEKEKLTTKEREMLWDDAIHYLEALQNKMKGMKSNVVEQKELSGGMSIEYYLEDIETDAGSMQALFEGLKKNKLPKID